jgi:2-methylcitrate synthase
MAESGTGKGLEGVVAAQTKISDVDGQRGKLMYAGYDIADLAAHSGFEETVYLLHHLELPTRAQLDQINADLHAASSLDDLLLQLLEAVAKRTDPMTALRTATSAAGVNDADGGDDTPAANLRKAWRLIAKTPQIVATYQRLRNGAAPVEPRGDLCIAGNFLYALTGEEPDPGLAAEFDTCLVLYADHTMNASTFAGPTCTRPPPPRSPPCRAPCTAAPSSRSATCSTRSAPRTGRPTGSRTGWPASRR